MTLHQHPAAWQHHCLPDKDMRQIPGELFDLTNPVQTITKEEGDRWHYVQTMADATDGYSGIPSIGIKRANTYLMIKDASGNCQGCLCSKRT